MKRYGDNPGPMHVGATREVYAIWKSGHREKIETDVDDDVLIEHYRKNGIEIVAVVDAKEKGEDLGSVEGMKEEED